MKFYWDILARDEGLKNILKVNRIAKADLKNVMESTYNAISNFQIRALYEGKDEILKFGRYTEEQFNFILDSYIDAETERNLVYKNLRRSNDPLHLIRLYYFFH